MKRYSFGLISLFFSGLLLTRLFLGLHLLWAEEATRDESPADLSPAPCEYCPAVQGLHGSIELGAAYVSKDSFDFGDLRGLEDKGASVIGNMDLRYWGEKAAYWELRGSHLGRDTRALSMKGGRRGRYQIRLGYDKIPRRLFDTAVSPYLGAGSDTLSLPSGWVTAGTTRGMSALSSNLRSLPIERDRENLRAGFTFSPSEHLEYTLDHRHEKQDGLRLGSGNFIHFSTVLPEPVHLSTDEIEAAMRYMWDRGQIRLAYYGSFFDNNDRSLTWDNPFTPLAPGGDRGQLALPPDNQAHQLTLSGSYQLTKKTRASGSLSVGQMTQDEAFVPTTLNPNITTSPLPSASLDGKVKTARIHFNLFSVPTPKSKLNLKYTLSDRNNATPRKTYDLVVTDTFLAGTRTHLPYSYRKQDIDLESAYRLDANLKFSGGIQHDQVRRDFQETAQTDEATIWFKVKASDKAGRGYGSVKIARGERDGNRYAVPDELQTVENPLLRKFNLADRDRHLVTVQLGATPLDWATLGFTTEISSVEYDDSAVGLTDSHDRNIAVDLSFTLPQNIHLYFLLSREVIRSRQNGSQSFGFPDWSAKNKDAMDTAGAGFFIPQLLGQMDLGFDFTYAASNGLIEITPAGAATETFTNLKTRLTRSKLYLHYRYNARILIKALYYYEKYDQSDWALDGVAVDTVANVLTSGASTPDDDVSLVGFSLTYAFSNE